MCIVRVNFVITFQKWVTHEKRLRTTGLKVQIAPEILMREK